MTVVDSTTNPIKSGILFRKGRSGPEQDLVDWFLELKTVKLRKGERLTIFREPRLPSGFPDLVAVVWKESVMADWRTERRLITTSDLRLMHHLVTIGPVRQAQLKLIFGSETDRSLNRLARSEMVLLRGNLWQARPLSKTFAIKRIIAVEAKIREWRAALDQAFINTWFTPESYVLVPAIPKGASLLDTAMRQGIGVLSKEQPNLWPRPVMQPRSYASWLFNEWTWRLATL
jgi:hypothetical protein